MELFDASFDSAVVELCSSVAGSYDLVGLCDAAVVPCDVALVPCDAAVGSQAFADISVGSHDCVADFVVGSNDSAVG